MSSNPKMTSRLVQLADPVRAAACRGSDFQEWRRQQLSAIDAASAAWNASVAEVVTYMGRTFDSCAVRLRGRPWVERIALALERMREPLLSDVILTTREPLLSNAVLAGAVRASNVIVLERDLEFMPRSFSYPKFPYFEVEPATQPSLAKAGLYLLANLASAEEEGCEPGDPINRATYARVPMIGVELKLERPDPLRDGAVLLNWSCRGRNGVAAKVFIDGELDVPPFEVMSTADDSTPNFWTVVPWREGPVVIDLKPVGEAGYFWFEHVDIHHVSWDD